MSESTPDGDLPDMEEPGTDLALDVVEGEIVDDDDPEWGTPDEIVDAVIVADTGAEVAVRETRVYAGYGAPDDPAAPVPTEHGQRPGGGSQGGMRGDPAGSGAGSGKRKVRGRRGGSGGSGGSGGGYHFSIFGGLFQGASVVKTGAIGSGNSLVRGGPVASNNTGAIAGNARRPPAGKRR